MLVARKLDDSGARFAKSTRAIRSRRVIREQLRGVHTRGCRRDVRAVVGTIVRSERGSDTRVFWLQKNGISLVVPHLHIGRACRCYFHFRAKLRLMHEADRGQPVGTCADHRTRFPGVR